MSKPGFTADCAKRLCNAPINVMPPGGGAGGARDEMGTLIICACPTWAILTNFEPKFWPTNTD